MSWFFLFFLFFIRGHSENESDSIQARIEAASKHVKVYTTSQWAAILGGAKRNKPFYVVKEMTQEDFSDLKYIRNQLPNMTKTVDRESLKFMSVGLYTVRKGDPLFTIHYNVNAPTLQIILFQTSRKTFPID